MKLMILLVSAVLLLADPDVASPTHKTNVNLKSIIDLAGNFSKTLREELFVEDLSDSACENDFFRKVYCILDEHKHILKDKDEQEIVRNLNQYVKGSEVNCTEVNSKHSGVKVPITRLLEKLIRCSRNRNFNGHSG